MQKFFRSKCISTDLQRLKIFRAAVCIAFVAGILFSLELWFPITRDFPRASVLYALPETVVSYVERLLCAVLIISLVLIVIGRRSKFFSSIAISTLVLLVFFDQMRLQPWVYQYSLLLVVLTLCDWQTEDEPASNQTLCLLRLTIAGLYFWSGAQKLNYSFASETLPILLTPLQNVLPAVHPPPIVLGLSVALTEVFIGCGLLFRRTRNTCVLLAAAMHTIVLGLLVAKDYNSIVWVWNATLIPIVFILFWKSDISFWKTITTRYKNDWKTISAKSVVVAVSLLPILSFWGWWDAYLSGALYSGNTAVAVVRINDEVRDKLPPSARQQLLLTKSGGQMLPLLEWALAELNVPVYPEPRVFQQATRRLCELTNDKSEVELVTKERPAIFDGSYRITRITCDELER